ncbi:MAG TPA: HAD family phosphatase [Candidatus Saccharimonadales bacterium]
MIKAVIFDCFGVLVGSGFWAQYEKMGGDLDRDGAFVDSVLDKLNSGKLSSGMFAQLMSDHLGITPQVFKAALTSDEQPNQELFTYIATTLKPRYKLAIASNATGRSLRSHIPAEELALFDVVLASEETGLLKPDPAFFKLALARLGLQPAEAVFIDDHLPYVESAAALGIHTIHYKGLTNLTRRLPGLLKT